MGTNTEKGKAKGGKATARRVAGDKAQTVPATTEAAPTVSPEIATVVAQGKRMVGRATSRHTVGAVRNKGAELATLYTNPAIAAQGLPTLAQAVAWLVAPSLVAPEVAQTLAPQMDRVRVMNKREGGYYTGTGKTAGGFPRVGIRDGAGAHSWTAIRDSLVEGYNEEAKANGAEPLTLAAFGEAMATIGRESDGSPKAAPTA